MILSETIGTLSELAECCPVEMYEYGARKAINVAIQSLNAWKNFEDELTIRISESRLNGDNDYANGLEYALQAVKDEIQYLWEIEHDD